jgi:hypothetical protein
MLYRSYPLVALLVTLAGIMELAHQTQAADAGLDKVAKPFFDAHCTKCHGEKKQKGDLRLDTLAVDFDSPKNMGLWMEIMGRITSGEMPPKKEARPKGEDVERVNEWITAQLLEAEARNSSSGDKIAFCKLSREEYANTIRDLLGVTYDAADPSGLPEDPDWHGFQRIGSVLTFSPAHIEKYMSAAEMVLGEALSLGPAPKREALCGRLQPGALRGGRGGAGGQAGDDRVPGAPAGGDASDSDRERGGRAESGSAAVARQRNAQPFYGCAKPRALADEVYG